MIRRIVCLFLLLFYYSSVLAWTQAANAIRITPNDYWYNHRISATNGTVSDDDQHISQWYLTDDYLNCPRAWGITTGDSSIYVAVVDRDLYLKHYDLMARAARNIKEINGVVGVDDDGDGIIDNKNYGYNSVDMSVPPWYVGESNIEGDTEGGHGTFTFGTQFAATNNESWATTLEPSRINNRLAGVAGIDWKAKIIPITNLSLENANYLRYLKFQCGLNIVACNLSWSGVDLQTQFVWSLLDADILPIGGCGNSNIYNVNCLNYLDPDSSITVATVNQNWLRDTTVDAGCTHGPDVRVCAYTSIGNIFYTWGETVSDPAIWTPTRFVAYPSTFSGLRSTNSVPPMTLYTSWKPENDATSTGFWGTGTSEAYRAIYNIAGNDTLNGLYNGGIYDYGPNYQIMPHYTMTSGAGPQVTAVVSLLYSLYLRIPATNKYMKSLQAKGMIERGCRNIDWYNDASNSGTNMCCGTSSGVACVSGSVYTGSSNCTGYLGYGVVDAYRTITLWGKVPRDTTLAGDVYVSGDVMIPSGVTVTVLGGTIFHIAPDDIVENSPWRCQLQYDMDGSVDDGDCKYASQTSGYENKIEFFVEGNFDLTAGTVTNPIIFDSHANPQLSNDWESIILVAGCTFSSIENTDFTISHCRSGVVDLRE